MRPRRVREAIMRIRIPSSQLIATATAIVTNALAEFMTSQIQCLIENCIHNCTSVYMHSALMVTI